MALRTCVAADRRSDTAKDITPILSDLLQGALSRQQTICESANAHSMSRLRFLQMLQPQFPAVVPALDVARLRNKLAQNLESFDPA